MKTMNIINYSGVTKRYNSWPRGNKVLALDDFSLQIEQGEVFGFLGPNGAGKSTALKILLNFVYPNAGTVSLMGRSVSDSRSRGSIGYLPENPYFYDYLTAEEILWFGGKASGLPKHEIHERTDMLLAQDGASSPHAKDRSEPIPRAWCSGQVLPCRLFTILRWSSSMNP